MRVLVTGCSGGMGTAVCRLLREKGWQVWGLDCRPGDNSGDMRFLQCDMTDEASVAEAAALVKMQTDRLDAIIHTAGIYDLDSLVEMDEARFRRIFEVNLFGAYRVNRAFLSLLGQGSRILITTSELAPLDPLPFTGVYAVSKTALEHYAASLRMELQLKDIAVSVIRPGAVETGLLGDSTRALDRFCENTRLYDCNARRFRAVVDRVEARSVKPEAVAALMYRALTARRPRTVYNLNRNPLLRLLDLLPMGLQLAAIRWVLRENKS